MRDYVQNVCCNRRNEIKNGWTFKLNKKKPTRQSAAYIRFHTLEVKMERNRNEIGNTKIIDH